MKELDRTTKKLLLIDYKEKQNKAYQAILNAIQEEDTKAIMYNGLIIDAYQDKIEMLEKEL